MARKGMFRTCVYAHWLLIGSMLLGLLVVLIGPLATLLVGLLLAVIGRRLVAH